MKRSPSEPQCAEYPTAFAYWDALDKWAAMMGAVPLGEIPEQEPPYSDPDHPYYQHTADWWKEWTR